MATGITWDVLRRLAGFRAQQGCAVSFYVNLSPSEAPTLADVVSRVTSVLDAAGRSAEAKREALTHAERQALREDLDRIGAYFDSGFDRSGVQGAAVFAAG